VKPTSSLPATVTLAFPPWKRIYGFRTDARVEEVLAPLVAPKEIFRFELRLEAHYHGDTVMCAFGRGRRFLLGYREGIAENAWSGLREEFGDDLISLGREDAARYAANSFSLTQGDESVLLMPDGVSERLLAQVRERGVTPITVDVSEFLKKGGGSVGIWGWWRKGRSRKPANLFRIHPDPSHPRNAPPGERPSQGRLGSQKGHPRSRSSPWACSGRRYRGGASPSSSRLGPEST
jgi:hypothetical protein